MLYTRDWLHEAVHWLALLMVAFIVGMRLIRGIIYSFKKDVSVLYMFLYLCALEIVPLILLYRWIEGIL